MVDFEEKTISSVMLLLMSRMNFKEVFTLYYKLEYLQNIAKNQTVDHLSLKIVLDFFQGF